MEVKGILRKSLKLDQYECSVLLISVTLYMHGLSCFGRMTYTTVTRSARQFSQYLTTYKIVFH